MKYAFFVLVLFGSAACSLHATMLPVAGPLTVTRPVPTIQVKADGILGNSGKISFVLPPNNVCRGRWSTAAGVGLTFSSGSLLTQYGAAYASGYSVSTGSGQKSGQALATCTSGQTFELEFVTGSGSGHGYGIGKDSDDNIYRFVF